MQKTEQKVIRKTAQPAATTLDSGKIRTGAGCRIIVRKPATNRTVDTGRIRMGAGCRIRGFAATKPRAASI